MVRMSLGTRGGTCMTESVEPTIIYDVVTKSVLVTSGHRIKLLRGPYESRAKALAAGKKFLMDSFWN